MLLPDSSFRFLVPVRSATDLLVASLVLQVIIQVLSIGDELLRHSLGNIQYPKKLVPISNWSSKQGSESSSALPLVAGFICMA
jgi:hypothetical protein